MSSLLCEELNIVECNVPVDLGTAITGDYVSLENYDRCLCVFWSGVGTAGDDPTISFFQASDVAGTGAKDLNPVTGQVFKKQAATSLASTGTWSSGDAEISANDIVGDGTSAEEDLIYLVEFKASDLDTENAFNCLRMDVGDVGSNAQLGAVLYIMGRPKFQTGPANLLTAIA